MREMYYFAYGSNMDEIQMTERCPFSVKRNTGSLLNHRLFFSHNSKKWKGGVLSVKPEPGKIVWGIVFEITPEDLQSLDYYEGYPRVYDRKLVNIDVVGSKTPKECWVYFSKKIEENVIPSEDYIALVTEAHEKNKTLLLL
jgi:gamma-glutamylcyclotransferase (GGCT)/AIG2-like uncharacterized protein YtfP